MQELLLVDFENVRDVDLTRLGDTCDVIIFLGSSQKNVPVELVTAAQRLGSRVQWHRIEGNGSNALDFHIACQLGRVLETSPGTRCIVLSKDKGFDPLLRYLDKLGLKCSRINSQLELDSAPAPMHDANYKRVLELLGKSDKNKRPRKLKTLSSHIRTMFPKKQISQKDADRIVNLLFANSMISETNNVISYGF